MAWILMSPGVGATEVLIINLSIGDYLFLKKYPRPLTSPYIYGEIRILITFSAESPYLAIIRISPYSV